MKSPLQSDGNFSLNLRKEYHESVFASWIDLRRVVGDRRRLLDEPGSARMAGKAKSLRNTPFQFAVKTVALPAVVLAYLGTLPSTIVDLPPTQREAEIARLEVLADSTEEAAHETLAAVDSIALQRAVPTEEQEDSIQAFHQRRLDSIQAQMPDTVGVLAYSNAVVVRIDAERAQLNADYVRVLQDLTSFVEGSKDTAAVRDSLETAFAWLQARFDDPDAYRDMAVLDSLNGILRAVNENVRAETGEIRRMVEATAAGIAKRQAEIGALKYETAGYQRQVRAFRLAELKLTEIMEPLRLPIIAGFVILNAFLFGLVLKSRYANTVRLGATLHMYLSSAFLFVPQIAFGSFMGAWGTLARFPDSPISHMFWPTWTILIAWLLFANYSAAKGIAGVVERRKGEKGKREPVWIWLFLLLSSFVSTSVGATTLNFATYPVTRLIVALNG